MMAARLLSLLAAFATVGAGAADFDPRTFGAKGDGVAKDTAAICKFAKDEALPFFLPLSFNADFMV